MTPALPVEAVVADVRRALDAPGAAVLVAAPGAGKTTVVPLRLLDQPWLRGRIIMLEPRRIAARAAAARLAWQLNEPVGETVGYRVRFDSRISDRTHIEVVTEGVLTRMLATDPTLDGYGAVIFDEFHERSLHADLGLALTLETRAVLRPELRVLVMSATIDGAAVADLLGGAPLINAPGRLFPVETRFRPRREPQRLEGHVVATIRESLAADRGDLLVFLPGLGEIGRVTALLADDPPPALAVVPLHGSLSLEQQALVLNPGRSRRVILATNIAETSLTVPGTQVVIDTGLMRTPKFSPRTGMTRLETVRVSRASADQRRGRAGRTGPGVCYRLWSMGDEGELLAFTPPAITTSDLAAVALELAAAGVDDPHRLRWLDPPPRAAMAQAIDLLRLLGALDAQGRLTAEGRAMANLGIHPRLAHMALRASRGGHGALAAIIAALLSDRDLARRPAAGDVADVDLRWRVEAVAGRTGQPPIEVDRGQLERVRREVKEWQTRLGVDKAASVDPELTGTMLAWAYPDRIAQRRAGQAGRFLLRNGRGASMASNQPLAQADFLVIAELDDAGVDSRILLAAPLDAAEVAALVVRDGEAGQVVDWDADRQSVRAVEQIRLGVIVVTERPISDPDRALVMEAIKAGIRRDGPGGLQWTADAIALRRRLAFLHAVDPTWPDVSDAGLLQRLDLWLEAMPSPQLGRPASLDGSDWLLAGLGWDRRAAIDRLAPERYRVPTGSAIAIDYSDPVAPVLPVRLQEMFGETTTPRIAEGRAALTIHLLSPAGRPLQITRDLAGFWRTSYHDVRREMKGRYPKHEWPEDPLHAAPTRRAKRRH